MIGDYSHVEAGTIVRKSAVVKAGVRVNNVNANEKDESHFREGERNG